MSVLGVDIGSETIKVVEMAGSRGRLKLLNYGVVPTPPGAVNQGDIQDAEVVADAVKQLVKSRKIGSKATISCVQGQQSLVVRIIEIPRMSKSELASNMKYEIERHVPFPVDQIILDWQVLQRPGEPQDTPNMEVLFAVAQEEMIQAHVNALKKGGLKPRAIDVQPLALSHSLVEGHEGNKGLGETVAVVNIGATVTDLSIIKDGILHFPRTIMLGGRSVTTRISEGLQVSEAQAERLKRQFGSVKPLPPELLARSGHAAEPEEAPAVAGGLDSAPLDFGADLFTLEPDESSDIGFGGTGTGQTHVAEEAAIDRFDEDEDSGRTPFSMDDSTSSGDDLFNFGIEMAKPAKPAPAAAAAPPAGDDDTFVFDFGDAPAAAEPAPAPVSAAAAEPAGGGEAMFDFELDSGPAAPAVASTSTPSNESDDTFAFDFGDAPGTPAEQSFGVVSDSGGAASSGFDFALDELDSAHTSSGTDLSGATEVGTSYDLGLLASDIGLASSSADTASLDLDVPEMLSPEDEERVRVYEVVEPVIRELATEVQRSLDYYRSRYEGAVVDRVTLVGGTARIPGLAEFFEKELGVPVDNGDPLEGVAIANPKLSEADLAQDAPLLAVAVGLAMRELC